MIKRLYPHMSELAESQRVMSIYLKRFATVCLIDVGVALVGIPLIPYLNSSLLGPIYLGGNIALSIWVLLLAYPIIERVLWITP